MIDSIDTNITQGKFKDWIKTSNSANPMSGSGGRGEKNEKGRSLFFYLILEKMKTDYWRSVGLMP